METINYKKHLAKDKILKPLLSHNEFTLELRKNVFQAMIRSVVSQQLNTKVAEIIFQRFLNLYNPNNPTIADVLDTPFAELLKIGLSNNKAKYVMNVAAFFDEHKLTDKKLHKLTNEELINLLTQIKGIGIWSVQMLLMFVFGREDVFSDGDFGIQKSMQILYNIPTENKKIFLEKINVISEKWKPYRTYACLHLWHYKDTPKIKIKKD
ncbi:MAG: DNA-3-methyladenine glycosylase 2 family protein [Sediminibacterium sp.]|nr:DNA-3-methyladenine glycosylase 2 family protein [Sediminibacterium sp.]